MAFSFGSSNTTTPLFSTPQPTNNFFGQTSAIMQKDHEVSPPPEDTVSGLRFSPPCLTQTYLVAGSWDNQIRCWEVQQVNQTTQTIPRAQQSHQGPVLDVAWSDDGTRVFSASGDKTVKMWDLNSNQCIQVAQHEEPVRTVHWIKASNYSCVMSGSWDKTLRFWDTRSPQPMMTIQLNERVYCADVVYPMAVVGLAGRGIVIYSLENAPTEYKRMDSPLKYQSRCVSIFTDKDKKMPIGYALGSVEGRVAIQYVNQQGDMNNFAFKCHRSDATANSSHVDVYAVNDIAFHPIHGTLATAGADGRYFFWDKNAKIKLSELKIPFEQPITRCCIDAKGQYFAYAVGYDWSKGHEFHNASKGSHIYLHPCYEEFLPKKASAKK